MNVLIESKRPEFITEQLLNFVNSLKQLRLSEEEISKEIKENFPGLSSTQIRRVLSYSES